MYEKQKGYTAVECIIVLGAVTAVLTAGVAIYAIYHFIAKYW